MFRKKTVFLLVFLLVFSFIAASKLFVVSAQEEGDSRPTDFIDLVKCLFLNICDDDYLPNDGTVNPVPTYGPGEEPKPVDPEASRFSCPIKNSAGVLCGSYFTPAPGRSCQHCRPGYPDQNPTVCENKYGTEYGVDIMANPGDPVYFPFIDGHQIEWTFEPTYSKLNIQKYSGVLVGGSKNTTFWLQYHHARSGKSGKSGAEAATLCPSSCYNKGVSPHVHVQMMPGSLINGNRSWYDAAKVIQCP